MSGYRFLQVERNMNFKRLYNQKQIEPDIYFKFICFYNAKTELYDRSLTDMRSPFDNTEAYIIGKNRVYSNAFAKSLYDWIVNYVRFYINQPFSRERWNKAQNHSYTAQGWIDMFKYFKNKNDKVIIELERGYEKL